MDNQTQTIATSLPTPDDMRGLVALPMVNSPLDLVDASFDMGGTRVIRTEATARREELFIERKRAQRVVKTLRDQLAKAQRRRSAKTLVPVDALDALLTRVENADA